MKQQVAESTYRQCSKLVYPVLCIRLVTVNDLYEPVSGGLDNQVSSELPCPTFYISYNSLTCFFRDKCKVYAAVYNR
jgi:hypothetical protein